MKRFTLLIPLIIFMSCATQPAPVVKVDPPVPVITTIALTNKNLNYDHSLQNYTILKRVEFEIPNYVLGSGDPIEKYFEGYMKQYNADGVINIKFIVTTLKDVAKLSVSGDIVAYKAVTP